MNAIITPAGRPLFSSNAAREFYNGLIEARPALRQVLACGGRMACEAEIALGLMTSYEMASRSQDADATDQAIREYDSMIKRFGYNPLDAR